MSRALTRVVAILAIALGLAALGFMNRTDALMERSNYCDMVKAYKASHGQYGWPDFNHSYNQECKP